MTKTKGSALWFYFDWKNNLKGLSNQKQSHLKNQKEEGERKFLVEKGFHRALLKNPFEEGLFVWWIIELDAQDFST